MNDIISQFRDAEKSLRSLTRAAEERSYLHGLYHFFDITERSGKEGASHLDILVKSLAKLGDRCANVVDIEKEYPTQVELEAFISFSLGEYCLKRFGKVEPKQEVATGRALFYNIGKSIVVLNALNRKVLTSDIPRRIMDRGDFMENYMLTLVNLTKDELIGRTKRVLERRRKELERSSYITVNYVEGVNAEIERYRADDHYARVTTTSEEGSFGHGTLELLTDKTSLDTLFQNQKERGTEEKVKFEYEVVRNCLEIITDFDNKQTHYLVGLTDDLKPKVVKEEQ